MRENPCVVDGRPIYLIAWRLGGEWDERILIGSESVRYPVLGRHDER
jgi:hypothetical protein